MREIIRNGLIISFEGVYEAEINNNFKLTDDDLIFLLDCKNFDFIHSNKIMNKGLKLKYGRKMKNKDLNKIKFYLDYEDEPEEINPEDMDF